VRGIDVFTVADGKITEKLAYVKGWRPARSRPGSGLAGPDHVEQLPGAPQDHSPIVPNGVRGCP
jgi:hypothetical protein